MDLTGRKSVKRGRPLSRMLKRDLGFSDSNLFQGLAFRFPAFPSDRHLPSYSNVTSFFHATNANIDRFVPALLNSPCDTVDFTQFATWIFKIDIIGEIIRVVKGALYY